MKKSTNMEELIHLKNRIHIKAPKKEKEKQTKKDLFQEKCEKKGELDLTYNFDDDVFNVTQEQMKIMDGEVNKIYNKYKKNMKYWIQNITII